MKITRDEHPSIFCLSDQYPRSGTHNVLTFSGDGSLNSTRISSFPSAILLLFILCLISSFSRGLRSMSANSDLETSSAKKAWEGSRSSKGNWVVTDSSKCWNPSELHVLSYREVDIELFSDITSITGSVKDTRSLRLLLYKHLYIQIKLDRFRV